MFWQPWGAAALEQARQENKPILLSIGYSTCYWCHVMEREVFENLSIASLMNRYFVNIKVDREEHPELDEIYMVARQLLTHEGGWPNNIFLTPELKPFYAGGTFGPTEAYGKPSFPRLLEWLNYSWTTQESEVRDTAAKITEAMLPYLVHTAPENAPRGDIRAQAAHMAALLTQYHDAQSGGFFQAPKFPHETYLSFLLSLYERTIDKQLLDMVTRSLSRMASGGLYDQVGGGFHRYAVDKDWLVPHFEKMLYNQAQMARLYTEAARITGNPWFADIACSVLDFVAGPLTDGNGAFYSAIDAETNGVEGAYYVWPAQELQRLLTSEETAFFIRVYALAEVPVFPGHKDAGGQVLTLCKPLDQLAKELEMPYIQLAAMCGKLMNKLLVARNQRQAPGLDDKIIVAWNGLMIDAYAHAGKIFNRPDYIDRARRAADFLLEHAIDNQGELKRIHAGGKAQLDATLEDYAMLVRGLLTLYRARPDARLLSDTVALTQRAEEGFLDAPDRGYFFMQRSDNLLVRLKGGDDGAIPNANAVMLHNLVDLYEITGEEVWKRQAEAQAAYFLNGREAPLPEYATMLQAAMRLTKGEVLTSSIHETLSAQTSPPDQVVTIAAALTPEDVKPGSDAELTVTLDIRQGWHINAERVEQPSLVPTQLDVQGKNVRLEELSYPEPKRIPGAAGETLPVYEGRVEIIAWVHLGGRGKKRPPVKLLLRFQPCSGTTCHAVQDLFLTL